METSSDDEDYHPNGDGADVDVYEANEEGPEAEDDGQSEAKDAENGMTQHLLLSLALLYLYRHHASKSPLFKSHRQDAQAKRLNALQRVSYENEHSITQQSSMTNLDLQGQKQLDCL